MFFKIVRNFKAKIGPFLLTLFLAPGYVHANTWEINVTRKDSNLYQITGKDSFVNTKYCYVYAFSEDAYLRVDGYDKKIIFFKFHLTNCKKTVIIKSVKGSS